MSNQSKVQGELRIRANSNAAFNEDWLALANFLAVPSGEFNERQLGVLNAILGGPYSNLTDARTAFANYVGASSWDEVATLIGVDDQNGTAFFLRWFGLDMMWDSQPLIWGS